MYRIDNTTAVPTLPAPAAPGTPGYFTGGDPASGAIPTRVSASWLNSVQEELMSVVAAASITPDKANNAQLLAAIQALIASAGQNLPAGTARNLKFTRTSATTAAFTADEAVVAATLGGASTKLVGVSKTLDIATVGAGGMDAGSAPANGSLFVYLIYNTTTLASQLIATTAGSGATIYPGSNMPAGYTRSALYSILRTNGSGQLDAFTQVDREVFFPPVAILSNATGKSVLGSESIGAAVPVGAKTASGRIVQSQTGASGTTEVVAASDVAGTAAQYGGRLSTFLGLYNNLNFRQLPLLTPQTIFWSSSDTRASSVDLSISSYTI